VTLLGSAFYGILTLLTLPFAVLFIVHMYRQFNGEKVV
jgi:nitric oxide reductase large subunit